MSAIADRGYVFQTFNLLQGYTALENVMLGMLFGHGVDAAFATRLLDRVGMGHRPARSLPARPLPPRQRPADRRRPPSPLTGVSA